MKKQSDLLVMLAICAASLLLYAKSATFPFCAIDDHVYVTDNPLLYQGFSLEAIGWAFTSFHAANWHPLTWLSLMLDRELFGLNPAGYHVVNSLLHALNSALLYRLFAALTGARGRSALVALCFALHPLHVESVAWIAERKDVLSTLLLILTLICYQAYCSGGTRKHYLLALMLFALGLMAKPMLVTLPLLLLLLDFWPLRRLQLFPPRAGDPADPLPAAGAAPGLKRLVLEKIPFLLLAAASALLTVSAQGSGAAVATLSQIPLRFRVANALWSCLQYLKKLLLPVDLAVYYPFAQVPTWKAGCAALLLGGATLLVLSHCRRRGYLALGWFWYLVTLLPVIGLVQVGSQAMADRYTYVPYIGLFVMAAWGGAELAAKLKLPEQALRLAAAGVLIVLSLVTWVQLGYWQDNVRLLTHTLEITENNYFTHFALGGYYEGQGKGELALEQYGQVLRINPGAKNIHLHVGRALLDQGRAEEALGYLEEALRRNSRTPVAHFYLGVALEKLARPEHAIAAYRSALELDPQSARYHTNLGAVLAQQGRLDEAVQSFSEALRLNPRDRKAAENLQLALTLKDRDSGR